MKLIAQGLFGKLPISDEYLLLGLPGWAVDHAWRVLDRCGFGAPSEDVGVVHRYALAFPQRRSLVYGVSWVSEDALGRRAPCSLVAIEKGRTGIPASLWEHPWFAQAQTKYTQCAGISMRDLVYLVTHWIGGLRLSPQTRQPWNKKNIDGSYAIDGGDWESL